MMWIQQQGAPAAPELPLHDIVPAASVGWWPLAWGWWVLIALLLCALVVIGLKLFQWLKLRRWRQHVSAHLQRAPADLSSLTLHAKQIAMVRAERTTIAALHGPSWIAFLLDTFPSAEEANRELLEQVIAKQYASAPANDELIERYRTFLQQWACHFVGQVHPPEAAHV